MSPNKFADMLLSRYGTVLRLDEEADADAALHEAVTYTASQNLWPSNRIAYLYARLKEGWAEAGFGTVRRIWLVAQLKAEAWSWVYEPNNYNVKEKK